MRMQGQQSRKWTQDSGQVGLGVYLTVLGHDGSVVSSEKGTKDW